MDIDETDCANGSDFQKITYSITPMSNQSNPRRDLIVPKNKPIKVDNTYDLTNLINEELMNLEDSPSPVFRRLKKRKRIIVSDDENETGNPCKKKLIINQQ